MQCRSWCTSVWTTTVHKAITFVKAFLHFCSAITVQFELDTFMVDKSDGMVEVKVAASGRTAFEYTSHKPHSHK